MGVAAQDQVDLSPGGEFFTIGALSFIGFMVIFFAPVH
jgi:hypothetical protein